MNLAPGQANIAAGFATNIDPSTLALSARCGVWFENQRANCDMLSAPGDSPSRTSLGMLAQRTRMSSRNKILHFQFALRQPPAQGWLSPFDGTVHA